MRAIPSTGLQWLVFGGLSLAWGSSFLFIKIGVTHTDPLTLVAGRFLVALAAVFILARRQKIRLPGTRRLTFQLLFLGLLGNAIPIFLISWGEQSINSGMASILNGTVPIWAVILAHFTLADEKATLWKVAGVMVGFIGMVVLVGWSPGHGSAAALITGRLAVVSGAVCYALSSIYVRHFLRDVPHTQLILVSLASALAVTGLLALIRGGSGLVQIHPKALFAMLWLGLVGTALAYQLYYRLLAWWGAGRATTVTYALPVVSVLLGVVFLDELLTAEFILGGGLVLSGVLLASRG